MKNNIALTLILTLLIGVIVGGYLPMNRNNHMFGNYGMMNNMSEMSMENMDEYRESHIAMKDNMIGEMLNHEGYKCCLKNPCTYCLEKSPKHGEGATCDCLSDIVAGKHPCGECIGEILEGHGNEYLVKYFPEAIAEEVGMQHIDTIREIISEKYDVPVEELL